MNDASLPNDHPAPMEGGGAYNRHSSVQASGLLPAIDMLEEAARTVPVDDAPRAAGPLVIADYGSSAGRNSLLPMRVAIAALRERVGAARPISVVHTDLAGNDFSALFRMLEGDTQSYLAADASAYPSAVGRSFYGPVLPPDSVTLGWSSWAVQWLSRIPATVPDHVQAAFSHDAPTRAAFAQQADADWRCFLEERSRELRRGAQLVVLAMAADGQGRFGYDAVLSSMHSALLQMRDEGLVAPHELARMVIPTVGRTQSQFADPFGQPGGTFEGLRLEKLDIFFAEDRIWAEFERSRNADAYGASWAAFSRASVFPTLAQALEATQDDGRIAQFMDRLEAGMATRLAAAPGRMNMPMARLVLVRQ